MIVGLVWLTSTILSYDARQHTSTHALCRAQGTTRIGVGAIGGPTLRFLTPTTTQHVHVNAHNGGLLPWSLNLNALTTLTATLDLHPYPFIHYVVLT